MSFLVSELRRSIGRRGRAQSWDQLCPSFGTILSNMSASEVDLCRLFSSSVSSSSSSSSSSNSSRVDVRRLYHHSSPMMMDAEQRPKALLRGTLTQAEGPLTAAEIWELVEPQGMKSKRFMKTMLKQMRDRGEVKTKPSDGSNNSFVYYHVSMEER